MARKPRSASRTLKTPRVYAEQSGSEWVLWIDGPMRPAPVGPRLYRGGDWPIDTYAYETKEAADVAASKVQEYLERYWG